MLSTFIKAAQAGNFLLDEEFNKYHNKAPELLEISYQQNSLEDLLNHLNKRPQQGWILFLAPPGKPNKTLFEQAGIDKNRIIMIDANKVKNDFNMLSTLLQSKNYCTIVSWQNELNEQQQQQLKEDCEESETSCFIYSKQ